MKHRFPRPVLVMRPCALAAFVTVGLMASAAAQAQAEAVPAPAPSSAQLERVLVTGSSIKRIDAETALPVQVIRREDIDKSGVTTAAELLTKISANAAGLTDGASITDNNSGQRGFNAANLRGIGVSSTLVLLNGRRLANFASPGDGAGVDLNNIPAAALQRVEVLKDGASAIYGTDAIGGVINFITRKDYQGVDIGLSVLGTQHGGAGKKTVSLSGGIGNLEKDRFNLFGVVDLQDLGALRSSQRDFIRDNNIPQTLPFLLSSRPFPGNVRLSSGQLRAIRAGGAPYTGRTINFTAPACSPPTSVYAPGGPAGANGCNYDYMQDTEVYPASQKLGFLGRATLQLNNDHQVFAEALLSRADTKYVLSPQPNTLTGIQAGTPNYPTSLVRYGLTGSVEARFRGTEMGNRSNEVTSEAQRLVVGASGVIAGWDYDTALNHSVNQATDAYVDGYVRFSGLQTGVRNGTINAFGPSSAAGQAFINSIKINDEARRSKGTSDAIDVKASRSLMALGGGDLAVALGAEWRREKTDFTPSALLISNDIAGDRDGTGSLPPPVATSNNRKVAAVYAELNAPLTKQLEAQFALRHDRYSGVGNTTNPKLGVRFVPLKALLFRGSAGTGFRAPSLSELYRPTVFGTASSILPDPVLCAAEGGDLSLCADQWPVERRSNPNLKPEKSRQFSLGSVFEPSAPWSLSVDYWNIQKTDVIADIGEQTVLANPDKYAKLITRDADGFITNIVLQKQNQGKLKTSGFDVGVNWRGGETGYGRFGASLNGTLVLEYKYQAGAGEAYQDNLGRFLNDKAIQRWRHRATVDWDRGPLGLSLSNSFLSGYTDQNSAIDLESGKRVAPRKVKAYSLWDLTASYKVMKNMTLRGGVLNLFDTAPPFTNQAYYFQASWDPTYADPRGRAAYVSMNYSFK